MFQSKNNQHLKEQLDELQHTQVNPYSNYKMWLRYEQLDIEAICEAIEKRGELEKKKYAKQVKLADEVETRIKIKEGRSTMKTFYMS